MINMKKINQIKYQITPIKKKIQKWHPKIVEIIKLKENHLIKAPQLKEYYQLIKELFKKHKLGKSQICKRNVIIINSRLNRHQSQSDRAFHLIKIVKI
jgi:hypothetical protein